MAADLLISLKAAHDNAIEPDQRDASIDALRSALTSVYSPNFHALSGKSLEELTLALCIEFYAILATHAELELRLLARLQAATGSTDFGVLLDIVGEHPETGWP